MRPLCYRCARENTRTLNKCKTGLMVGYGGKSKLCGIFGELCRENRELCGKLCGILAEIK